MAYRDDNRPQVSRSDTPRREVKSQGLARLLQIQTEASDQHLRSTPTSSAVGDGNRDSSKYGEP